MSTVQLSAAAVAAFSIFEASASSVRRRPAVEPQSGRPPAAQPAQAPKTPAAHERRRRRSPQPRNIERRPDNDRLHRSLQRYQHPFLPDHPEGTCLDDRPAESWEAPSDSLAACCDAHFAWRMRADCLDKYDAVMEDRKNNPKSEDEEKGGELEFFPNNERGTCYKEERMTAWQTGYASLKKCCGKNYKHKMKHCMELGGAAKLLDTMNPFLPDWGNHECNRNREAQQWEKGYSTAEECCRKHFSWEKSCLGIASEEEEDDDDDLYSDGEEDGGNGSDEDENEPKKKKKEQPWWHPFWAQGHCSTTNDVPAPAYMTNDPASHMDRTYKECCERFVPEERDNCLELSEAMAPPTPPPAEDFLGGRREFDALFWPEITKDKCQIDGNKAPRYMKKDPFAYFFPSAGECCREHFPRETKGCVKASPKIIVAKKEDVVNQGPGASKPAETANPALHKYDYYPKFDVVACVKTPREEAPSYMYESPSEFFFLTFDECCSFSFDFEYSECLMNSELIELDRPLDNPHGDGLDGGPREPAILIEFSGKLYFRNVFIPSGTPGNMRIVRDAILNSVRVPLEDGEEGYRVSAMEAINFDGIDLGGLDELLAGAWMRGRGRRRLSDALLWDGSDQDEGVSSEIGGIVTQDVPVSRTSSRRLSRMQLFRFSLVVSLPCPQSCAIDIKSSGRSAGFDIAFVFEDAIQDGTVFKILTRDMDSMRMVGPFFSASLEEGYLQYETVGWDGQYTMSPTSSREPTREPTAKPTRRGRPTRRPTRRPTHVPTDMPIGAQPFYPDFEKGWCVSDGKHSEFGYTYDTMEECCKFPWLQEAKCLAQGAQHTKTQRPTEGPSPHPSPFPTSPNPTEEPTLRPSRRPTPIPTRKPSKKPVPFAPVDLSEWPTFSPTSEEPTTLPPTERPTTAAPFPESPSGKYTGKPCGPYGWHVNKATNDGCTNDSDISEGWLQLKDEMFFSTPDACCDNFFSGRSCEIYGCGGTPGGGGSTASDGESIGDCEVSEYGWHLDRRHNTGCTNDDNIVQSWLSGNLKDTMFHSTSAECCEAHFLGISCEIRDCGGKLPAPTAGEDPACEGFAGWYFDRRRPNACTNDSNYPKQWLEDPQIKDQVFFSTAGECCTASATDKECKAHDYGCGDLPPEPDVLGSCSYGWHIELTKNDGCIENDEIVQGWLQAKDRFFFATREECCNSFFKNQDCKHYDSSCGKPASGPDPPDPPTPNSSTSNSDKDFYEDFEGGDLSSTQFTTSGLPWMIDDEFAVSGSKSVKNSVTRRGESSKLSLVLEVPSDGVLSYELRHDVFMPWAKLEVKINEVFHEAFINHHEGTANWESQMIPVTRGLNEIVWDVNTLNAAMPPNPTGTGTVWIDDVRYFGYLTLDWEDGQFDKDLVSFSGLGRWKIDDSLPGSKNGVSAHSPKGLLPGEHSTMEIKWTSLNGGQISFDCHLGLGKVSFYVDDSLEYSENQPGRGTRNVGVVISPGFHILSWKYEPPPHANMPVSNVWIDNVVLV